MLPISSNQPSQPPISPSTQSQSPSRPSRAPHNPSLTPDQVFTRLDSGFSDANSSLPYPSPPLFMHRASHVDPQASLPHTHPPHMVHSSSPFVSHHQPGMPGREASLSHVAHASSSMTSMLRPHAPIYSYSYQGASSGPTPSSHQTYGASTSFPTVPVYPHHPASPTRSLSQWQASTSSTGEAQHPTLYTTPGTYSPLRYTTRPPSIYDQTSYVPVPSIYGSHYPPPHHTQSYSRPPEQEGQGVWWYLPPGATAAVRSVEEPRSQLQFKLDHPSPGLQNEDEQSQTRTSMSHSPSLTNTSPFRSRFRGLSDPRTEITLPSLPASSASSHTGTTKTPPSSESKGDGPHERRSYHPKSPAHRSEWVMWVGNVPSDMTPEYLRAFFNRSLPPQSLIQSTQSSDLRQVYGGVLSVFLIARSNCAFVNFESEAQLDAAIVRFHDKPIWPDRPPFAHLVCRVRKRADDLKAGVGAQRGSSMHIKWIKEQRERAKREGVESVGLTKGVGELASPLLTSDDDGQGEAFTPSSSQSGSLTSTNSGILSCYFPQRYFILKSRTEDDLDLSVQNNVWETQQHNEEILDQAYRTSQDVFLVFGVNKSGEFYGYARMAGPILHSEGRVSPASRPASFVSLPRSSAVSDVEGNMPNSPPARIEDDQDLHYAFTAEEHRVVVQPSKAISQSQEEMPRAKVPSSSATELRDLHHRLTGARAFELSADAPYRSIRDGPDHQAGHPTNPALSGESDDILEYVRDSQPVAEELTKDPKEGLAGKWGRPFRVDWIRTKRLSFIRTKHLRNPWNSGREVKISRDGTELEPSIGRQLLEEWDKRSPSPADIPVVSSRTALQRRNSL